MRTKFRAALGSLLVAVTVMTASAAVVPSAATAHGETGPLCYGYNHSALMWRNNELGHLETRYLWQNEPFRILTTEIVGGIFYSFGHSATSNQVDYWVRTQDLICQ